MHADWIDLCASLNESGARYLVIGGMAVAFHGFERFTKDLDIWVAPTPDNAKRVIRALREFGAPVARLTAADFEDPGSFVIIGVEPYRVDILMGPPGLEFDAAWPNRQQREIKGALVNFVSLPDLLTLKRASGRPQDKRDVAALTKVQKARRPAANRKPARKRKNA